MKKILVMIPHGEVYNRHNVRAYSYKDIQGNATKYYNMGDLFVYDSSLKLLNFDYVEPMKISVYDEKQIDRYNEEFEYCFLRGSNYLHPHMDWLEAERVLEKIKIPVVPFAIGAQAPREGKLNLSPQTIRVLQLMAERCKEIGVRGTYTANLLNDLGIKNVRIVGCPTLFRHNRSNLNITLPPLEEIESVGFSLRREVNASYSDGVRHYFDLQRQMIFWFNEHFSLTIMSQGETEEKQLFYTLPEFADSAVDNLNRMGWLRGPEDPMLSIYKNQMFYDETVSGYDEIVRKLDLVVGFRLHGNLIALANGTPAIYCTYDSRTREFVETYDIPAYDIDSGKEFVFEEYYQQSLFDKFNLAYAKYYQEMGAFLTANGMDHKMHHYTGGLSHAV
jgi:hypothetical protein